MVMAIAWTKEYRLVGKEIKWYKENWARGQVLENSSAKLVWDFEFNLRKTTTARGVSSCFGRGKTCKSAPTRSKNSDKIDIGFKQVSS